MFIVHRQVVVVMMRVTKSIKYNYYISTIAQRNVCINYNIRIELGNI